MSRQKSRQKPRRPAAPVPSGRSPRLAVGAAALAVLLAGVAAIWWWQRGSAFVLPPSGQDENVLLVTIDTLRADALSSYGGPARTVNLDALAAKGARFTFAHSHAVVTLPSHTSILTGQFPYEHGMRDNSGFRVKDGTATIATRLKALGFSTGAFVGGFPLTKRFGLTPGFDEYDDQMPEMHGAVSFSLPERPADQVVTRALDWIGKRTSKFFAWVHVYDPHSPYRPPSEYAAQYSAQPYYGEVAFADHALGPLFDRLATLSRPTLVVVTADHGESLGEHGELTHGMFAYEATLHIPLIVAQIDPHATKSPRGVVIDAPVRHIDITPTILDAVGAPADPTLPGASLRNVIGGSDRADRPEYFESMTYNLVRGWPPLRGVLTGRSKYIDLPIPELYDLAADPKEARNLASAERDRMQVMNNTLRSYSVAPPDQPGQDSADSRAALKSLGYLSSGGGPVKTTFTEADDPKRLFEIDRDVHTATEAYQNGNVQEAIALLDKVLASRPDTSDAVIQLAYIYWETGEAKHAIDVLEGALAKGSIDRDIRIRLGLYLSESGANSARAIKILEGMPPTDVEGLNGLGVAYGQAHRYADATRTFNRVLALDPTNGLALQNLASAAANESKAAANPAAKAAKLKQAEALVVRAIQADPSLAQAYTTYGAILSYQGRQAEAIDSWKHAVDLDNTEFDSLYNLWLELGKAGRKDDAVRYGRQFVATAPPAYFKSEIDEIRRFLGGG